MRKIMIKRQTMVLLSACLAPFAMLHPDLSLAVAANTEMRVTISADRFNNLGVTLGKLEPVAQIPMLTAPAKVVVPPAHEYLVSASQSGLITQLNASIGDLVRKGDVLAELNSPDLLSMQRLYLKAENELQLGSLSNQRDKKLFEEGVIAERRWQETHSQYNAFASEANEHRQLLEIAGMSAAEINRLKSTHRLNSKLQVRTPISGTVLERMGVAGSRVDMLAPLYRIADLSELWLEINIPQERAAQIKIGDKVAPENTDPSAEKISAKISQLSQNVNLENQTVLARAIIDGKHPSIRPGQRINIQIMQATATPAFKVPNAAIAQNEGKSYLFIRTPDGFRVTPIAIIGKQNEESVIGGELSGDEDIAVKGAVALKANWLGLGSGE